MNKIEKVLERKRASIESIVNAVNNNKDFLVSAHIGPEGDAIGSALALSLALKAMDKNVVVYFADRIPPVYGFMPSVETITNILPENSFDAVFAVDCGEIDRLGEDFMKIKDRGLLINLDHHATNDYFGDLNFVYEDASAAGEVVYRLIRALQIDITLNIAINLYVAILTDTGSFRYGSTTSSAFKIAADLVEIGVSPWEISKKLYESYPEKRLKLLGLALNSLDLRCDGKVAMLNVTRDMLDSVGASIDLTESFVNYPRSIDTVEVAVLIKEIGENEYKLSFRSKGDVDVSEISSFFGGGGHQRAAGCAIKGILDDVKERVVRMIDKIMNQ